MDEASLPDDRLLKDFVATRSSKAFAAVVRRHVGLVYAAALRQTRDHHLAEDITQSVFVLLGRKAHHLSGDCVLAGWLLKTTRFVALDALKLRDRRRRHERRAAAMRLEMTTDAGAIAFENAELASALDDGMLALGSLDRRAILMRFYERKTFEDVGRHLGIDAEAARKRVGRAIERLRDYFIKRNGRAATTVAVTALLGLEFCIEAPPHVAAKAIRFAVDGGTNALANSVSGHLLRVNLIRWSLGVAAFACVWVACGNSLRPVVTLATSAFSHPAASEAAAGN